MVGGRYTIGAAIGRGARSTTYRAWDPEMREVALKLYDTVLPSEALVALRRAGEIAAAMTGAALAPIDAGVDADVAFLVCEPSGRPSLAQLVEVCPLAPPEAAALARSLARALGPAHERGLTHGAIHPANVFVGPPPAFDVRVSDFGASPTRAWMAPELAQGAPPGVAADVYAAALTVFFALTGRPFGAAEGAVDTAWASAFQRALHPEPRARYSSLDALAGAFERAARGEASAAGTSGAAVPPAPPPDEGPITRASPRGTRPRAILAVAAACLLLLFGAVLIERVAKRAPVPVADALPRTSSTGGAASAPLPTGTAAHAPAVASSSPASPAHAEPQALAVDGEHAMLVVACKPPCDSVWVDGHPVAHADLGHLLPPGVHMVGANLAHHASKVQPVLLRRGHVERLDVSF